MAALLNLALMTVSGTPGTGTITLGTAATVNGVTYLSFAAAGAVNATVYDYSIQDVGASEIGTGTYTSSGTTLTRTPTKSTNANAAINASSAALVSISPRAETLNDASLFTTGTVATARLGSGTANSGSFLRGDQTWTAVTIPVAATQSDMEAATSTTTFVTPQIFKFSPFAAKAWVKWGVTSTILASSGVTSITDNGVGDWTVNWSTAFSSANYVGQYTLETVNVPALGALTSTIKFSGQAAGSLRVASYDSTLSLSDGTNNHVVAFGDQ